MPRPLSERLRAETTAEHRAAERSAFFVDLFRGRAERGAAIGYLAGMRALSAEVEDGLERLADHPAIGPLRWPALYRTAAIDVDLAAAGASPSAAGPVAAATAARVRERVRADPIRLVAHAYVRFFGDLSGGQLLGRPLQQALGLDAPLAAFDFGELDPAPTKAALRARLDALPLTGAQTERVLQEARRAFEDVRGVVAALVPAP